MYLSCGVPGCPDAPNDATMRFAATLWDAPGVFRLPNIVGTSILRDTWHRLALYFKFETVQESSGDGIFRAWVDGVLNTELLTLTYPVSMGTSFSVWALSWSKNVATGQTMYVDHTTIRGQ